MGYFAGQDGLYRLIIAQNQLLRAQTCLAFGSELRAEQRFFSLYCTLLSFSCKKALWEAFFVAWRACLEKKWSRLRWGWAIVRIKENLTCMANR